MIPSTKYFEFFRIWPSWCVKKSSQAFRDGYFSPLVLVVSCCVISNSLSNLPELCGKSYFFAASNVIWHLCLIFFTGEELSQPTKHANTIIILTFWLCRPQSFKHTVYSSEVIFCFCTFCNSNLYVTLKWFDGLTFEAAKK